MTAGGSGGDCNSVPPAYAVLQSRALTQFATSMPPPPAQVNGGSEELVVSTALATTDKQREHKFWRHDEQELMDLRNTVEKYKLAKAQQTDELQAAVARSQLLTITATDLSNENLELKRQIHELQQRIIDSRDSIERDAQSGTQLVQTKAQLEKCMHANEQLKIELQRQEEELRAERQLRRQIEHNLSILQETGPRLQTSPHRRTDDSKTASIVDRLRNQVHLLEAAAVTKDAQIADLQTVLTEVNDENTHIRKMFAVQLKELEEQTSELMDFKQRTLEATGNRLDSLLQSQTELAVVNRQLPKLCSEVRSLTNLIVSHLDQGQSANLLPQNSALNSSAPSVSVLDNLAQMRKELERLRITITEKYVEQLNNECNVD